MENPRQKIKSIKNPIKHFNFFNFIKPETSDSFLSHFDGHFAYLKTLDFYFNPFTAMLSAPSLRKRPINKARSETVKAFIHLRMGTLKDFYQNVQSVSQHGA